MKRYTIILLAGSILGSLGAVQAASPPEYINYQGVLRDAAGHALDGDYDMQFHFYDSDLGGNRLLTDRHTSFDPVGPVTVAGGLFNVHLGGGTIAPGTHATLGEMFAAQNPVWLEVEIRQPPAPGEVLSPRVRVISAAYALNAGRLDGREAASFLDTSSTPQTKSGTLTVAGAFGPGIDSSGTVAGGHFSSSDSGSAWVGFGNTGIEAYGSDRGGYFYDLDNTGVAFVGVGDKGIEAYGSQGGGYFKDADQTGHATVGIGDYGVMAYGSYVGVQGLGEYAGGHFKNTNDTSEVMLARALRGIDAFGTEMAGYFYDHGDSGTAHVAYGDKGIEAHGHEMGGHFNDSDDSGYAYLGIGNRGIEAVGNEMGGYFWNSDRLSQGLVAFYDTGIEAWGDQAGGAFKDWNQSGHAKVGYGDRGIEASGHDMGGYFKDSDHSGYAHVGVGDKGIEAYGSNMGGYFEDLDGTARANVGVGDKGIEAHGTGMGGIFYDTDGTSEAHLAWGTTGVWGRGTLVGGYFVNQTSGNYAELGGGTFKIQGNGANPSFVQNHPERADRVIVYAAPEGNEIATYTRGTARLVAGEARIRLDETFRWVTNPDIGLTAYLTPHGECNGLYVDSLSTEELVVRELGEGGGDVVFDYIVWGLRIGFEELPVVQEKRRDAYLPRIASSLAVYEKLPELRLHNALERFKAMRLANGETDEVDLSAALALREAIGVYDPAIHGDSDRPVLPASPGDEASEEIDTAEGRDRSEAAEHRRGKRPGATEILAEEEAEDAASPLAQYPASQPIEVGDLVALDVERHGYVRRCARAADAAVFGIAAGDAQLVDEELRVQLVESRYARVKADASYGVILPGDLLVSSPTPGHAMRAVAPLPGTIVGKAAEPLEAGTGLIKVLVMLR